MLQDDIVVPLWRWVEFVLGANLIQIGEDMMEFFFYLHFNGLFSGEPGLAGVYW